MQTVSSFNLRQIAVVFCVLTTQTLRSEKVLNPVVGSTTDLQNIYDGIRRDFARLCNIMGESNLRFPEIELGEIGHGIEYIAEKCVGLSNTMNNISTELGRKMKGNIAIVGLHEDLLSSIEDEAVRAAADEYLNAMETYIVECHKVVKRCGELNGMLKDEGYELAEITRESVVAAEILEKAGDTMTSGSLYNTLVKLNNKVIDNSDRCEKMEEEFNVLVNNLVVYHECKVLDVMEKYRDMADWDIDEVQVPLYTNV